MRWEAYACATYLLYANQDREHGQPGRAGERGSAAGTGSDGSTQPAQRRGDQ
jgi:hypothetical protein